MNKYHKSFIAIPVCLVFVLSGCETMGGSAGLGALLGAAGGAIIGSQTGDAAAGAAIGAGLGAGIGALAFKIKNKENREIRSEDATVQEYKYEPSQGMQVYLEPNSGVTPTVATSGEMVEARLQYAILGAPASGVQATESQVLLKDGKEIVTIIDDNTLRNNGTFTVANDIEITPEVQAGNYTVSQKVKVGEIQHTRNVNFVVNQQTAHITGETIYLNGRLVFASSR